MKRNVILVNGTNPETSEVLAQMKETGCTTLAFTGIGKAKAQKLVDSLPNMKIKFVTFRRLDNASEEYLKNNYTVVSTIGDFCKGKGKKPAVTVKYEDDETVQNWFDNEKEYVGLCLKDPTLLYCDIKTQKKCLEVALKEGGVHYNKVYHRGFAWYVQWKSNKHVWTLSY